MSRKVFTPEFEKQWKKKITEVFIRHLETWTVLALKKMNYLDDEQAIYILEEMKRENNCQKVQRI